MHRKKEQEYRSKILDQGPTKMAPQTQKRLEEESERLQHEIQEKTAALGKTMDSAQDWHDNPAYEILQQELTILESLQLSYSVALNNPEIITPREEIDTVQLGNTVVVRYQDEEQNEKYTILGPKDNMINKSWISADSPLGNALIGHQSGSIAILPEGMTVELIQILPGEF